MEINLDIEKTLKFRDNFGNGWFYNYRVGDLKKLDITEISYKLNNPGK
jgi:hypothetical protein